ncbi:uncharacterized protein LOC142985378 [Anticarsia gemmatalis]|uniref:uncharacterized protein LOC142985378 n=1 Tax=Anticarsia gemmatalis TaxID=129554 RepID=UPI003F75D1D7
MRNKYISIVFIFYSILDVKCGYPPIGDEVQAGSVLLPASRRGRYLANIVRRQAVDGTGIKFNRDADRMNAEAKKKVDVLSEELLPYIIAEQERRTTLYKRVMTAIQNGEKGVTIAEIRNKPPAIIRKGLMYRCPTNRAPKEPDGSGVIMCEDNIEPSPIMYESCLSAEDKELYVAENKYFFCNRHKIEGPDLPRNGTTVIGCSPSERTSLNYTSAKCALEDTDDVVVHYRYYPDRTYKFVTELDPDREVCEHWNPCQVGYIFSLPSPDQATSASELWQDTQKENVNPNADEYETGALRQQIPEGTEFDGMAMRDKNGSLGILVLAEIDEGFVECKVKFTQFKAMFLTELFTRFLDVNTNKYIFKKFIELVPGITKVETQMIVIVPGQKINTTSIKLSCVRCTLRAIMLRGKDGAVKNMDTSKYRVVKVNDNSINIEIELEDTCAADFGDYYAIIQVEDGSEERVRAFTISDKGL